MDRASGEKPGGLPYGFLGRVVYIVLTDINRRVHRRLENLTVELRTTCMCNPFLHNKLMPPARSRTKAPRAYV